MFVRNPLNKPNLRYKILYLVLSALFILSACSSVTATPPEPLAPTLGISNVTPPGKTLAEIPREFTMSSPVGKPAPDLILPGKDGHSFHLAEQKGHVVYLNFWNIACTYCRQEMPQIEALWQDNRAQGLLVWGVDAGDTPEQSAGFLQEVNVHYPILYDPTQKINDRYQLIGFPLQVFVDRLGIVRVWYYGAISRSQMDLIVQAVNLS